MKQKIVRPLLRRPARLDEPAEKLLERIRKAEKHD